VNLWPLWGKTRRAGETGDATHALLYHLIDVAAVAETLWDRATSPALRKRLGLLLGLSDEETRRCVAYWASLHDLGKACPAFQMMYEPAQAALLEAGYALPMQTGEARCYHGTVTTDALGPLLLEKGVDRRLARGLACAVGGHHGAWPTALEKQALRSWQLGGPEWDRARREILGSMDDLLGPPTLGRDRRRQGRDRRQGRERQQGRERRQGRERLSAREVNCVTTLVAGITAVADWIGSMNDHFPHCSQPTELDAYLRRAQKSARAALEALSWQRLPVDTRARTFDHLYPDFTPNDVQKAAIDLAERLSGPSLVIVEAPTGCGKTEAAMYLAQRFVAEQGQAGTYVALPTMATSNQMHCRVSDVLTRVHGGAAVWQPLLVHSQARWRSAPPGVSLEDGEDPSKDDADAMAWFLPRKRSLLAPYGVGTVDQSFLSVLQTRHFFVRLLGLAHKTIVFDEVHAYDAYMTELFQCLLRWLRAMDTSVVVLSATLSSETRQRLVAAYSGAEGAAAGPTPALTPCYPSITWASNGEEGVVPLPAAEVHPIGIQLVSTDTRVLVKALRERLRDGGCAAVICNTVGRSQAVYRALREERIVAENDLILFHARFPAARRNEIEQDVLKRFGKDRVRRAQDRAIVVATQVIEQSLDLDFDTMISDLAPVDLLIQRAGRMHRHERGPDQRPASLREPILGIVLPDRTDAGVDLGPSARIYEPYILLRTLVALEGKTSLCLPAETPRLIAAVYDEPFESAESLSASLREALQRAKAAMEKRRLTGLREAMNRLVPDPDDSSFLSMANRALREEDPEAHRTMQALTRLSPPSVSVVCLHARDGGLYTSATGGVPVDLEQRPDDALTRELAGCLVSVSHRGVVNRMLEVEGPQAWRRHPLLRHCRPVSFVPVSSVEAVCRIPGCPYTLYLSPTLGLEIEKESP